MQGRGVKVLLNGSVFEGTFDSNKLTGHGRAIFYDGSQYIGQWGSSGLPHGTGDYTTEDGYLVGTQWYNYINVDAHQKLQDSLRSLRTTVLKEIPTNNASDWMELLKPKQMTPTEKYFVQQLKEPVGQISPQSVVHK